jgi:aspartyl-tRNA(Asn)/glutamyl-tRNA(Gln) amidotransferase subunit A
VRDDNFASIAIRVERTLERIASLNPRLNAFIAVFESSAMAQARELDAELRVGRSRGPLHGATVSIKDLIDVEGTSTTAASRVRRQHMALEDATVVARLRAAGAVIIGKCNMHEFALGTTNEESAFGPAHNPHDTTRSPGGSSGGSAAAVAADLCWASVGSDTGGSIRIPAAACGVVGLKPTFGEVPTHGVLPLSVSLDHVGPVARNVADAASLLAALKGTSEPRLRLPPAAGLRLARLRGYFDELLDAEVRDQFEESLRRLQDAGASITDLRIPGGTKIAATYVNVVLPEAFAFHANTLETSRAEYSPGVAERLEAGRQVPAEAYVEAQRMRGVLRGDVDTALKSCDALVLPTLPIPAPKLGAEFVEIKGARHDVRPLTLRLTQLFNLTGHPAISLPCGYTAEGLPCGLQLVGRRNETDQLLAMALSCEAHVTPRAPLPSERL